MHNSMFWPLQIIHNSVCPPSACLRHCRIILAATGVCGAEPGPAETDVREDVWRRCLLRGGPLETCTLQHRKLHRQQCHRRQTTYLLQVQGDEWELWFKGGVDQGPFLRTPEERGARGGRLREVPQGGQAEKRQVVWIVQLYTPTVLPLGELNYLTVCCTENYSVFFCFFCAKSAWGYRFLACWRD